MTEQEAIEFCKNDPESAAKIILMVQDLKKIIAIQPTFHKQHITIDLKNSLKSHKISKLQ